jgi:hypothetical protein
MSLATSLNTAEGVAALAVTPTAMVAQIVQLPAMAAAPFSVEVEAVVEVVVSCVHLMLKVMEARAEHGVLMLQVVLLAVMATNQVVAILALTGQTILLAVVMVVEVAADAKVQLLE